MITMKDFPELDIDIDLHGYIPFSLIAKTAFQNDLEGMMVEHLFLYLLWFDPFILYILYNFGAL